MTEVEKARVIVKIDSLKRERIEKQAELVSMQSMHLGAWDTYGSELCAGGMLADEAMLSEKIKGLDDKISILESCISQDPDLLYKKEVLEVQIKKAGEDIEKRSEERNRAWGELRKLEFMIAVSRGEQ